MMTWEDFKLKFSKYHVPQGLIKKMRDEFRELKQGRMTVVEYRDSFLTLSRYAPCRGCSSAMPSDRGLGLMESCKLTRDIGTQTSGESDLPRFGALDESSNEEISSPRFISTKASEKLAKIFSDMSFESSADSYISDDSSDTDSFDFIDKSISIGKVFTNLYDGVTKPNKVKNQKYHQVYAIGEASRDQEETSEAFDDLGNPYVDPSDLRRGLGTKYVGPTPRVRIQLPQAAWDRAMDGSEPMETTATVEELQAYQYRLARAGRELEKETDSE
ncbi:hypothetical protein QYE76_051624 [Lolium multiflorum]|uniref:Retrotransposon gag domain-containing protein n=1 Tax=Lolium multiflorum TaxID=4521 RepID=A0AAD8STP2_LOLMU|nr:hypothetical protein QYE76_051624 [Lolium multiflorum]